MQNPDISLHDLELTLVKATDLPKPADNSKLTSDLSPSPSESCSGSTSPLSSPTLTQTRLKPSRHPRWQLLDQSIPPCSTTSTP